MARKRPPAQKAPPRAARPATPTSARARAARPPAPPSSDRSRALAAQPAATLHTALLEWYRRVARDLPWRRTKDPYAIWISETMLQQTTVEAVLPYYARFLARYPDVASLARSREDDLLALWSGLGYYRRARNLRAAAAIVHTRHGGRLPSHLDELRALPGIGRYTAGAIASLSYGAPAAVVDVNVARVLSRLYALAPPGDGAEAGTASEGTLWRIAEELLPRAGAGEWNQALMELGATICRPAAPDCARCPLGARCLARATGEPARYSPVKKRPPATEVRAAFVAVVRAGRVLMVRRDARELLGGLWELPGTLASALRESGSRRGARPVPDTARIAPPRGSSKSGRKPATTLHEGGAGWRIDGARREQEAETGRRHDRRELARRIREELGFTPRGLERIGRVSHVVTYRKLTIDLWRAAPPEGRSSTPLVEEALLAGARRLTTPSRGRTPARGEREPRALHRWFPLAKLSAIPLGAATRKALALLLSQDRTIPPRGRDGRITLPGGGGA